MRKPQAYLLQRMEILEQRMAVTTQEIKNEARIRVLEAHIQRLQARLLKESTNDT